mgnify:CR=1 FL=1|jgi:uncharacterized small protein (DUF1192 family)
MAIFDDDEPPKPKGLVPRDLEPMSVEALEDYVAELQTEIERVKTKIDAKQSARGAAEGFFKK